MCKRWHANANAHIRHFKLGKGLKLKCAHRGCSHVYQSFSGLRKHLIKCCANDNLCFDDGECSTTNNSISLGDTDVLPSQSLPCDTALQERNIVNSCATILGCHGGGAHSCSGLELPKLACFFVIFGST